MMEKSKPKISQLVAYFKSEIQGCAVTDEEIEELKKLYPNVSFKDLNRTFHGAIRNKAMQPISYMIRQLNVLRPASDPFNSQVNQQIAYGKKFETGTDWDTIYARLDQKRKQEKENYDRVHGQGSYDRAFKKWANEFHWFVTDLEKKYSMYAEDDQKKDIQKPDPKADAEVEKLIQESIAYSNLKDKEKSDPVFAKKQRKIDIQARKKKLQAQSREAEKEASNE